MRRIDIIAWSLTYHRVCDFVLNKKLTDVNQRWPVNYPGMHKNGTKLIAKMGDFADELKESEVIAIYCSAAL
jgi:hypothetical protein